MTDYGQGCMVDQNLCQAYLQEVGLTKMTGDHDFFNMFSSRANFMVDSMSNSRIDSRTYSKIDKHHQVILLN
jgi:hypothetical protein